MPIVVKVMIQIGYDGLFAHTYHNIMVKHIKQYRIFDHRLHYHRGTSVKYHPPRRTKMKSSLLF